VLAAPRPTTTGSALDMTPRSTLALVAVVLAATPVHAQAARGGLPPRRIGIVGGVNLASMTETEDTRRLTGSYVGGQLVLPRKEYFAIQLEVAWSQKGVRAAGTDSETGEPLDITLRNDYVEVPILMRLDSPLAVGVHPVGAIPFVVFGPALGVSVRCTIAGESPSLSVAYDCDDQFGVKTFDFGAMLGVGLDALVGTRALSLGARYTLGLQDVFDGAAGRNRAIMVVAGVNF
jgi:hypothetical protein